VYRYVYSGFYLTNERLELYLMLCRYLQRTFLPSCSRSKLEKRGGTDPHSRLLLSLHEQLRSDLYHNLLYITDMIRKGSFDRRKVGLTMCYICTSKLLNKQHLTLKRSRGGSGCRMIHILSHCGWNG
jgi:hypothetical protein